MDLLGTNGRSEFRFSAGEWNYKNELVLTKTFGEKQDMPSENGVDVPIWMPQ